VVMIEGPHRRRNALTGEWVLVSAGRTNRPWQGAVDRGRTEPLAEYDPACYLCPGNRRAGGQENPDYDGTFVFTNDFAALSPDCPDVAVSEGLLVAESVAGTCRVLCFDPRHDLTLAMMHPTEVRGVIDLWAAQSAELGAVYPWVQVFENRGEMMGASNPHPHGQIWASSTIPVQAALEDGEQLRHLARTGSNLLIDYALQEQQGARVLIDNPEWLVVVPFWAVWPFEALVVPRRPVGRLPDLDESQRHHLSQVLPELLIRYDNLFEHPFPYSMGWHGAPYSGGDHSHWQLHAHLYPPLLRSASVRKFMVGYELLAEAQRDITAEDAAARLREVPDVHYTLNPERKVPRE
jgi:UDPglucose--hexose-1-phosphate uridylyltransferase